MATVVIDDSGKIWEEIVREMLATSDHIIALRGAGSFNGISIVDANKILDKELIPRIESCLESGTVSIIFDGDNDDPEYPDIGHIMGGLRDYFGNHVNFYAVQVLSWYEYREGLPALKPLHSAHGNEYRTVLFPDKKFVGEHDHFSQHVRLAQSPKYEQWYIGACGQIANKQLADYSAKVEGITGKHAAVVFRAPVSIEQGQKINKRLEKETDPERRRRLEDSLARRTENPYGLLCTPDGEFISKPEFANLQIEIV